MTTDLVVFKLMLKPLMRWAAPRALVGRNRSRQQPDLGRFTQQDVRRYLAETWRAFDGLAPDVSKELTVGSRLNVRLAALTLAMHRSLTDAGIERGYAIELLGDTCWQIYQYWGSLGRFVAPLFPQRGLLAKRPRPDGTWPIAFRFTYPGYVARYVPTEKGVGFDMVRCPVAEYFRAQGAGDVAVGSWCTLDYALGDVGQIRMARRTQTLAAGDSRCDFRLWPADPE